MRKRGGEKGGGKRGRSERGINRREEEGGLKEDEREKERRGGWK